jgi:pimeloyl-ACP methyl ester carboxylesterase
MPDVPGVEHDWVDAGGLRTHVASAGPEDGAPVLCLHGWPQHWYLWRDVIDPLAEAGYRVICPDLRGLGWTEAPESGYEKEQLADDVLALMDSMGIGRARLVGHDWGGWVGYLLALRASERVARLLALNILPPFVRFKARGLLSAWRLSYQWLLGAPVVGRRTAAHLAELDDSEAAKIGLGPRIWTAAEREIFLAQFAEPDRAHATVQYYRTFQTREIVPILRGRYREAKFEVPTHLMFGTDDAVQDEHLLEGLDKKAPSFSYELIDGVSHFIVDERPELVVERALEFFA